MINLKACQTSEWLHRHLGAAGFKGSLCRAAPYSSETQGDSIVFENKHQPPCRTIAWCRLRRVLSSVCVSGKWAFKRVLRPDRQSSGHVASAGAPLPHGFGSEGHCEVQN